MKPHVSDELVDQLVCGSLRGGDYRKAILALEAEPERWRDCALAFLQEQAITQELKELSQSNVRWDSNNSSTVKADSQTRRVTASNLGQHFSVRALAWRLCSLAALLLVSFGIGWASSSIRSNSASGHSGLSSDDIAQTGSSSLPDLKFKNMTVDQVLPNSNSGSNNYSLVGNKYSSFMPIDEEIPANLAKLEREGHIRIEKSTSLMPVEYGDATVLVPVQQLRVVPVTFSY